jgi:uncharacterized integral membrane protein
VGRRQHWQATCAWEHDRAQPPSHLLSLLLLLLLLLVVVAASSAHIWHVLIIRDGRLTAFLRAASIINDAIAAHPLALAGRMLLLLLLLLLRLQEHQQMPLAGGPLS